MIRWIAAVGALVISLDSTMNIAFPAIAAAFAVPPERVRWVIVCYVLVYALLSLVAGALADRVGHGRVFRLGLALSVIAFVMGGLAPTFGWLLIARVLQGLGGGCVYGTAPGLVTLGVASDQRGRALGFLAAAMGLGLTVGPVIAGVLVDAFGWRAVFHLRVPLMLATLIWAVRVVPGAPAPRAPRVVAAGELLRGRVLFPGALSFVANAGMFAIWLLAPFYLVAGRGMSATVAGVLFMLTPLGTTLAAPLAGRLSDRTAARVPVAVGLGLEAAGLALLSRADPTSPLLVVVIALFAAGFGLGTFQVPNMAVTMAAFPALQQGAAGGFAFLARTLGVVTGVLGLAQLFAVRRLSVGLAPAAAEAFLAAGIAVGLAAIVAGVIRAPAS
ncbi:MAG TPA: MFS transporter [Methylomirabilota bacterium]|nr:MFS transporter [Methylomirabilota bacterium]